jgi:diguanylate cyclase (GGDEF)-like protein
MQDREMAEALEVRGAAQTGRMAKPAPSAEQAESADEIDLRHAAPVHLLAPSVAELRGAGAAVLEAASRIRTRWSGVRSADLAHELPELEHQVMALLAKVNTVVDDIAALELTAARDRQKTAALLHQASVEREMMRIDDVTGALERRHGLDALRREIERSRRDGTQMVVGFVDVDGLKRLNDRRGHAAGDTLLRATVLAIKGSLRSYDVVVRLGGDEFVYSLAGITAAGARTRAAEIKSVLRTTTGGGSVSIGMADVRPDDTVATVVARADADLYARRGRDRR